MIIYGSKSSHLNSTSLEDATCPNCESVGQMFMSVYSNYAHVFWIPFFPFSKKVYASCNHCKATYTLNELPPELKDRCYTFQKSQKKPLWQFAGLAGIILCIIVLNIMTGIALHQTDTYFNNPMVNDVYKVKYEKNYSTMKIVEISGETIFFAENEYYVSSISKTSEIDEDENYDTEELLEFTLDELKEMRSKRIILSVHRGK